MLSHGDTPATHTIQLRFLGAPVMERDSQPIAGVVTRKGLALLAYLAVRNEPIPRSQLIELFWEGQPEGRGRTSLRQVLHRLNAALPGCLTVERHAIRFARSSSVWLDLRAFDEQVAHGHESALAQAAALYRGEFMAGLFLDDCADFEAWLVTAREHWQQRLVRTLTTLVIRTTERQDWELGLQFVDRLLALDPWQETVHRQKMSLLAHLGQRATALAQYEACRRILAEEIGVEPSAETSALFEHIRSGRFDADKTTQVSAPAVSPMSHSLPRPLTSLLGRDDALAEVKALLRSPACRLITLIGPPGIGKTRLSLEVGNELAKEFADGVCFVDLAPISEPGLVVDVIAHALNIRETSSQSLLENLMAYLQDKRMLLLLDNFEQVLAAAPSVVNLLSASHCAGLKVLVTSRAALRVRGEHEVELQPLALPAPQPSLAAATAATLLHSPAVQLFAQRAQAARSNFAVTDENASDVAELCVHLDGLPLAIELAAARVKLLTPSAMLQRLRAPEGATTLHLLTGGPRDLPPRQQALRAAIAWSHALLDDAEKRLFHRLGVFVGGWTLETAEAVCGIAPLCPEDVLDRLTSLVDKSLVRQAQAQTGELRFAMLATVREFAQEQLQASDEAGVIRRQHAHVFAQLARECAPKFYAAEQIATIHKMESEHDNVRAALRWSLRSNHGQRNADQDDAAASEIGLKLAAAAAHFWSPCGYLREGRDWLELALSATAGETSERADALLIAGYLAFRQGDLAAAQALEWQSLAVWERLGDQRGVARCQVGLSYVAALESKHDIARNLLEQSMGVLHDSGDEWTLGLAFHILGLCAYQSGDLEQARPLFEESLTLMRRAGEVARIALPLSGAARVAYGQGDLSGAHARLEEALAVLENASDRPQIPSMLFWLGQVARLQGNPSTATRRYLEALKRADEAAVKHIVPSIIERLVEVHTALTPDDAPRRARLLSVAEAWRVAINVPIPQVDRADYDHTLTVLRTQLDEARFAAEWAQGQAMTQRQAIVYALEASANA